MKSRRRRLEVNLDGLDKVLDEARQASLSEADYDKLKGALHALAAMLAPLRTTEKTSVVVKEAEESETNGGTALDSEAPRTGYGRNGAEAFTGAQKVQIAHPDLHHRDRCLECRKEIVYGQKEPKVLVQIIGQAPLATTVYSLERLRCGA
jgi:hypothetical protein